MRRISWSVWPTASSPRAASRTWVRASTSRTTSSRRPSLDPKWYRSMRWLLPIASAMRRRLWSARPSVVKCSMTASSRRSGRPASPPPLGSRRQVGPLVRACTKWYTHSGGDATGPRGGHHGPAGDRRDGDDGADPASVYALLADGSTWPDWSPIDAFTLIEPGAGTPEGLGAVRLFTTGRHRSRERVVECRPGEVFSYVLEQGLPLRDYKAVITLTPVGAARRSTGTRPSGPRCPARAGSIAANWASSSSRPWRDWP